MKKYIILLSIISLIPKLGLACFSTPPEQITPPDELIQRSKRIVLATVVSAEFIEKDYDVIYTFKVDEKLKGEVKEQFTVIGRPLIWDGEAKMFDHHKEPSFWKNQGGRLFHDTDCEIYPSFSVGATYLVFLDKPYHRKSFELIIRTHGNPKIRDSWLSYVEQKIKNPNQNMEPMLKTPAE
ncbi:hypothetical protein EGM51_09780 [Verrucomicrobia bacterium S94]|nr:hypothetical protein EGM51_09780 [Verrucomicrobia bacterium S94]